jgi:glycosyltransferase involved in cell wall biosynthesis
MNGGAVVAQCQYGQSEMKLALGGMDIPYIFHGYDPDIFRPLDLKKIDDIRYCYYKTEDGKVDSDPVSLHTKGCYDCQLNSKEQAKCPYYKEENVSILRLINGKWAEESIPITGLSNITKNKWVFGFVGQNIGIRKRIERLLKAYSIFIKDSRQLKDRTVLHLHTKPIAIDGINLIKVIQDLGIQDNIIFSYGTHRSSGWTEQAINILYNTFDTNISASSSEGFGLPTLESMVCGIPNIGPDCSSFTELIGEDPKTRRGLLASIIDWQMIQDGCLVPDSPILTLDKGIQMIKDIKIGDKVLTHKGRFMRVSNVMSRRYNGDMIKIISHKLRHHIVLTPEHRVLGVKTKPCSNHGWAICHPGRNCYYTDNRRLGRLYKRCKYIKGEEPFTKYRLNWIDAKDLNAGDYVTYPRFKEKDADIDKIRILDYTDDFLNITGDYDDNTEQTDLFGGFIEKKIRMFGKFVTNAKEIPAEIELTKELMRLFGYFIAEGHNSEYEIGFTFNINEIEYVKDVEILVKDIFGLDCLHNIDEEDHKHQLVVNSKILSNLFQNMFCPDEYKTKKGKGSKANIVRIPPEFLNLPLDKLAELIKGEYRGDGSFESYEYNIITSSETLANQLLCILSRFNILASIYKKINKDGITYHVGIQGKDVEIFDDIIGEKHEYGERTKSSQYLKGNNFFFVPIKNIDIIKYNDYVWNLEVEEDNTYISTITVHNSYRALVNEVDLANQMKTMYQREDLRKTFSKNAIKFAQDYIWEKIVQQWDQLLKTVK